MNLYRILLITIFLCSSTFAFSDEKENKVLNALGHIQGNGGDVVYCPQENGTPSVELLDLYEARERWGLELDFGAENLTPIKKIYYVLDRLDRIDHFRAEYYRKKADEFFENALFLSGKKLIDVPDSQFTYIPSHCDIKQIAIQKTPKYPNEKLYTISQDLWTLLDNDNKAGLILHEIVYGEAILLDHINSIDARYFMGHIASNIIDNMNLQEYADLFQLTNFLDPGIMVDGIRFNIDKLTFFENGRAKSGSLYLPDPDYADYPFEGKQYLGKPELLKVDINGDKFVFLGEIEFFSDGNILKGHLPDKVEEEFYKKYTYTTIDGCNIGFSTYIYPNGTRTEFNQYGRLIKLYIYSAFQRFELYNPNSKTCYEIDVYTGIREIDFYDNGIPKSLMLDYFSFRTLPVFQREVYFLEDTYSIITFHYTGYVASGTIQNDEALTTNKGDLRIFKANSFLNFDTEGRVIVD